MKKAVSVVLTVVIILSLSGCSLARLVVGLLDGPEDTSIEYEVNPALHPLEIDEFYVYEGGKVVYTPDEMLMDDPEFSFRKPYSEYYGDMYRGEPYDYRGRNITTKRGIRVGSTLDEVVAAYGEGIEFTLASNEVGGGIRDGLTIGEVTEGIEEGFGDSFNTKTFVAKDGRLMTYNEMKEYLDGLGYDKRHVADGLVGHFDHAYKLSFAVEDGVVTGIGIKDTITFWNGAVYVKE